ncbi:MAG TPA: hypothetical protein DDW50_22295 [Firmicutes bacterium]|jgi:hypothetical protein|nr:hypothetical protein [Bacillota bacterium]
MLAKKLKPEEIQQLAFIIAEKSVIIPGTTSVADQVIEAYTNAIELLQSENEKAPSIYENRD